MYVEQFLSDRFPTAYKYNPWKRHFDAALTSYCVCPQGCGGLVRPGDDYYRRARDPLTIHVSCAEKIFNLWRGSDGMERTDSAEH